MSPTLLPHASTVAPSSRGLHSFTFHLNVSAVNGIGAARRDMMGVIRGNRGVIRVCRVCFWVRNGSG